MRKQKSRHVPAPPSGPCGFALFSQQLARFYSEAEAQRIVEGSRFRSGVTLRVNTLKASREDVVRALETAGLTFETVEWYRDALILPNAVERDIWNLSLYRDGLVYLQSLSSMIPALVLDAKAGEDVLDMCAAPGGKTSQIAALTDGKAHVTACELHAPRAEKLLFNLGKLGVSHATVMQCDARQLDSFFSFDRILVDAPCTGSGTLDLFSDAGLAHAEKRFTPALLEKSMKSQRALLIKALELLKPGGTCVYSTCSVLKCENEEIVSQALDYANRKGSYEIQPIELPNDNDLPILPSTQDGCLTLYPTDRYEGFFITRIVRK